MGEERIPEEVAAFIRARISSVTQLELLLLLWSDREKEWTIGELSRVMRTNEVLTRQQLVALDGLVSAREEDEALYRIANEPGETMELVGKVAATYQSVRYSVIDLIYFRSDTVIRALADAFKLKKE